MFKNARLTTLDLSSFDTTNVTDMSYMFKNARLTTLDLSSFDMSNVSILNSMLYGSTIKNGYARTQKDADKLNAIGNLPAGLRFVVKE